MFEDALCHITICPITINLSNAPMIHIPYDFNDMIEVNMPQGVQLWILTQISPKVILKPQLHFFDIQNLQ